MQTKKKLCSHNSSIWRDCSEQVASVDIRGLRMEMVFSAVTNNDLLQLQEVLMENTDLDVNLPLIGSMTALHVAAEKGYPSCVVVLLSAGADVDLADEFGYTPLMNSIIAGYPMVAKKLLTAPCKIDQLSHHGLTALHMAIKKGTLSIVNMLLRAGAMADRCTRDGQSALSLAFQNHDSAIIKSLLLGCRYIDPNGLISKADSLFYKALISDDFDLAKALLLTGYRAKEQMQRYLNELKHKQEALNEESQRIFSYHLPESESNAGKSCGVNQDLEAILPLAMQPLKLQHMCRLHIRRLLSFDIWRRVSVLQLPEVIQEYICFRDICEEPPEYVGRD